MESRAGSTELLLQTKNAPGGVCTIPEAFTKHYGRRSWRNSPGSSKLQHLRFYAAELLAEDLVAHVDGVLAKGLLVNEVELAKHLRDRNLGVV